MYASAAIEAIMYSTASHPLFGLSLFLAPSPRPSSLIQQSEQPVLLVSATCINDQNTYASYCTYYDDIRAFNHLDWVSERKQASRQWCELMYS